MLAISTATKKAYIAIEYNGKNYYSDIDANCKQSENILKEIDKLLEKVGISFSEVGNIGVVIGPGSFTGVRIGTALVKGLCAGDSNHKVIPISTFDFMAEKYLENQPEKDFACGINALSGRIFVAEYNKNGKKVSEDSMISQEEFSNKTCDKVVLGEEFSNFNQIELDSISLLRIAKKLENDEFSTSADQLSPVYIRKSQAEENIE